jgi:glycosyltransferase involved in cell wall biosynthesis
VGGVQEVMRQIAERLAAKGHEVTVATSLYPGREVDTMRNGVRVISFSVSGNLVKGLVGPVEKYQHFLHQDFDAILIKAAQQWTFDAALEVIPKLHCRKLFIPCGFSALNDPLYSGYFRQMPDWLRYFNALIFYANDFQDITFARQHNLQNLHLIPNGVDEREFVDSGDNGIRQRLSIDRDHDVLLSVGSQIAGKGHWEVIRAFGQAQLKRPATLVLNANAPGFGLTRLKRHFKHALRGRWPLSWLAWCYGNDHKRIMIVDLARADLLNLYKTADLFVMASHVEYSPLVLFEAAAAGTAFLASSAGNSQEIAQWTGGGVVIPGIKSHSAELPPRIIARYMEELLANHAKLFAMGRVGREAIFLNGLTWEVIVRKYLCLMFEDRGDAN